MIEGISQEHLIAFIVALVAVIEAIYAMFKQKEVRDLESEKEGIISFYDSDNTDPIPEEVVRQLPPATYQMDDATKQFILFGLSSTDQAEVLRQIDAAEASGKIKYDVSYSKGWYRIEYGLIASAGAGGPLPS